VGTVAGVVLGAIFLLAGGGKLASRTWPEQARALGAPSIVARFLPGAEVTIGALLTVDVARRPLALSAAALLVGFSGLLARRLRQGQRPPCACFGGRRPRPIGPWTLARNAGFLAIAAVAILAD
jgi:TRAP-type C4-dicarboxylate transport system permease small subunit